MGEKMTLEQVRDWHRKKAREMDVCGELRFPGPNESPFYRYPSDESKAHDAMADAIDAHITQPAQAVDMGAEWRPFYASVIQSLAVLARAQTTDDGPREAILRDTGHGRSGAHPCCVDPQEDTPDAAR
jgi:hypothetical protein